MSLPGAELTPEGQHLANEARPRETLRNRTADVGCCVETKVKRRVEPPIVDAAGQPAL